MKLYSLSTNQEYLPKQLSREEVKVEVEKIISEIGATSMKDMGAIMKEAKAKIVRNFSSKTKKSTATPQTSSTN